MNAFDVCEIATHSTPQRYVHSVWFIYSLVGLGFDCNIRYI